MSTAAATPELLEREAELEALDAALGAASAGAGRLVLLEGEAGSGKTELLAVARSRGDRAGFRLVTARGSELELDVPFGAALELFGRPLQAADPVERAALFRGAAELAVPLFSAAPASPSDVLPGAPSNFPVVHGLYWLLANLAESSPLLLTVDDAQWVDTSSLRFLLYLTERLDGLPVVLAVALTPEEASTGGRALARLRAAPRARILQLERLSKDATAELVRARYFPDADDGFCRVVFDVSAGNPFLAHEMLRAVDLEGLPATGASAGRIERLAPPSLVRAIWSRMSRLRDEAVAMAEAAAVLGPDAHLRLAAGLAGLDIRTAAKAAGELVAAGVIRPGEPLDFVQRPIASAVYTGIPPARRSDLHGNAARLLGAEELHPDRLAAHLLHSSPAGQPEVIDLLRRAAARAVTVGSPDSAARYLRRALAEPPSPEDRPNLLVELGRLEAQVGDRAAIGHLQRAVKLIDDPGARAEALYEVGRALVTEGSYRDAVETLRRGLEEAGSEPSELRHRLLAALLQAARLQPGSRERGLLRAAEAVAVELAGSGSTPGHDALLAELSFERLLAGRRCEDVRAAARQALATSDPLEEGAGTLPFYDAVAVLTWADDLEEAEESLNRAVTEAERQGRLMTVATACFRRATALYLCGSLSGAVADAQRAVDAAASGWAVYLPGAQGVLALALIEQGQWARAAAVLERGESPPPEPTTLTRAIFLQARSALKLAEGEAGGALDDALAAGQIMVEDLETLTPAIVPWRSMAATAHQELGHTADARRLAGDEVEFARTFGASRALGTSLRVQGLVEGGRRGIGILREAVGVLAGSPARLERARALADLGSALVRAARPDAVDPLRRGLELADACGAAVLVERIEADLKAAGARVPRRMRRSAAALTPTEERVARLVSGGLTNKEVAQKLFVSVRAVEFHLGNVYPKLGIASRRQLASALAPSPTA
ncbi:MAG TPA: AAA family ATPase [Acidimicrobiia bacterium]